MEPIGFKLAEHVTGSTSDRALYPVGQTVACNVVGLQPRPIGTPTTLAATFNLAPLDGLTSVGSLSFAHDKFVSVALTTRTGRIICICRNGKFILITRGSHQW